MPETFESRQSGRVRKRCLMLRSLQRRRWPLTIRSAVDEGKGAGQCGRARPNRGSSSESANVCWPQTTQVVDEDMVSQAP